MIMLIRVINNNAKLYDCEQILVMSKCVPIDIISCHVWSILEINNFVLHWIASNRQSIHRIHVAKVCWLAGNILFTLILTYLPSLVFVMRIQVTVNRPLSRRLDRWDRVIQNESGDSTGGNTSQWKLRSLRVNTPLHGLPYMVIPMTF